MSTATATSMVSPTKRIAVVTGGNKGIGFEICKQLASKGISVVLTARDVKRGIEAVEKLKTSGLVDVVFHQLDVTDAASSAFLASFIKANYGKLDILVNNAGVLGAEINIQDPGNTVNHDINESEIASSPTLEEIIKQTYESAENCLRTNYYGSKQATKALIPLLQQSNSARIVNVSSSLGQLKVLQNEEAKRVLGDIDNLTEERIDNVVEEFLGDVKENLVKRKGWTTNFSAYIVSKAALNAFARISARKYPTILINSVHPGYVSTDINYNTGPLTVEEGAKGPVMPALMRDGGPSGLFFNQMEVSAF